MENVFTHEKTPQRDLVHSAPNTFTGKKKKESDFKCQDLVNVPNYVRSYWLIGNKHVGKLQLQYDQKVEPNVSLYIMQLFSLHHFEQGVPKKVASVPIN